MLAIERIRAENRISYRQHMQIMRRSKKGKSARIQCPSPTQNIEPWSLSNDFFGCDTESFNHISIDLLKQPDLLGLI